MKIGIFSELQLPREWCEYSEHQLSTSYPARVAERISTLDLVSNGRVEMSIGNLPM